MPFILRGWHDLFFEILLSRLLSILMRGELAWSAEHLSFFPDTDGEGVMVEQ